ncbi:MAG: CDP-alcohol phosphatidyltransferase family protein [Calditrichales bacterium]|nr:MAG: CDP-alcohol phosphatidyltransferase family protein [Calditrichales bacterium]
MNKKEIFTLSNIISLIRFLLAIPIFWAISENQSMLALILIVVAALSDWLDGYFARKWKQITSLGKIIDPLADKSCTVGGFLALSLYQGLPFWITAIIIGRDIIIIIASIIVIGQKNVVMASNIPGKISVFLITLLGVVFLMNIEFMEQPLLILAGLAIAVSLINYGTIFFKNFPDKR